jgi:hypothetical protein
MVKTIFDAVKSPIDVDDSLKTVLLTTPFLRHNSTVFEE